MKIPQILRWMIRQSLGSKRGDLVLALLSGPLGELIDFALKGEVGRLFGRIDAVLDDVRAVLGDKAEAVAAESVR